MIMAMMLAMMMMMMSNEKTFVSANALDLGGKH